MNNLSDKKKIVIIIAIGSFLIIGLLIALLSINESKKELTGDDAALAFGTTQKENYPILSNLPSINAIFQIGYTYESSTSTTPILTITSSTTYLDSAISKLKTIARESNDNLLNYNIIINNFKNPFQNNSHYSLSIDPSTFILESFSHADSTLSFIDGQEYEDYYYAKITTGKAEQFNIITYNIILQKFENTWQIISEPNPILTKKNTKNIPEEILINLLNL